MNVYIGAKKVGKNNCCCLTIYSVKGQLIYSCTKNEAITPERFSNTLNCLLWGVKKLKYLGINGVIDENEVISMFIGNNVVYNWFSKDAAPKGYTNLYGEVMTEIAFLVNRLELTYNHNIASKLIYKDSVSNDLQKVTDFIKEW